jgi:hypothetical protein
MLQTLAAGAGSAALGSVNFPAAWAQQPDDITAQIRADLEKHASFGDKFSAGPGDLATANWISGRLRGYGYNVKESEFDAPFFVKRTARLTAGSAAAEVMPGAVVVPTGASGITAPLALFENGANRPVADARGKIALLVLPFGRHAALGATGIGRTVKDLAAAGARAVVLVTTGPSGEAAGLNVPEEPFIPVPMAILAPKLAEPLVAAARSGATATLTLDGDATHRPSKNIIATIERGDRWIGLSTPRSGWFGCVGERGTGTAIFLELASWMARSFPNLSVFAMNSGGHEYNFAGSHRVIGLGPNPQKTIIWAHIGATVATRDADESQGRLVMLNTADPQRSLMTSDAVRPAATEAFRGLNGLERPGPVRAGAGELSAFTDRGYVAFAVLGIHRWFHTVEDTLERVDAALVTPVLRAHQRTVEIMVNNAK